MQLLEHSWRRAWSALHTEPAHGLFKQLVACYREAHRRYHTLQHLSECLEKLEPVLGRAEHPGEVEVALWFHDAIYAVKRQDNEQQSALWAKRALASAGYSAEGLARVYSLIMATRHSALPQTADERLLVDIDLSILGATAERFAEYGRQVRQEYAWVPDWLFWRKRKAILQEFMARQSIYGTEHFYRQYEAQARQNLEHALASARNT